MAKTSKSGKSSRKAVSAGVYVIIVAILLIIACFFTYISGVLPRTVTGVSITENTADGKTSTIKNFSVLETNFHFKEVFDSYSQYGMVSEELLDQVYDPTTGETYREWLLREAAKQMRTLALVERAAKDEGFMDLSKAKQISGEGLDTMDLYAVMYGYPSAQAYLSKLYGTGMTKRAYIDFMARETLVQEFGSYKQQFDPTIVPTEEEIQAKYDENPFQSYLLDYNLYFLAAERDADDKVVNFDKTVEAANKIAKSKDSAAFRQGVMDYLAGDEEKLASFADDADPTLYTNASYSSTQYSMPADIRDFFYSGDSEIGSTKIVENDNGVYVALLVDKKLNEIKNVSYRTLTLSTGIKSDSSAEDISAAVQKTVADAQTYCTQGMAPIDFYKAVKDHSTDSNEILTGGIVTGATVESFVPTEDNELDSSELEAGQWLFDGGRQTGDIKIVVSENQKTVTVYYFESAKPAWYSAIRSEMIQTRFSAWNAGLEANNPGYVVNSGLIKYLIY